VGIGIATLSVIHRWSIHVMISVEPLDIAMAAGLSLSTRARCAAIASDPLG
jgi:hypothetical protein